MTRAASVLLGLLRSSLGYEYSGEEIGALTSDEWNRLVDIAFEEGGAALAVDGLQRGIGHDNDDDNDNYEALEALDSEELEDLKYEWLSPLGFSSFAPRQLSVLFNRLLSA